MENTEQTEHEKNYTQHVTNTLMIMAAGRSSNVVDSFTGWLAAGVGGFFALLFSNLDGLKPYIEIGNIKLGAILFFVAIVLTAIEKYIAAIIQGTVEAAKEAKDFARETFENDLSVDLEFIHKEFESAAYPPTRWLMHFFGMSFRQKSPIATGRRLSRQAQLQSYLAFFVAALCLTAVIVVVLGVGG